MSDVRYFKLKNKGAFVARIAIEYKLQDSTNWSEWHPSGYHDICASAERTVDLIADANMSDGVQVRLKAVVVAGKDKTAGDIYTVSAASNATISYEISGTSLIDKLKKV